jgi:uncharacterized damage-inducible protein DinB
MRSSLGLVTMRTNPDAKSGERDALAQYLDYQRETILLKCEGLSKDQLAQRIPTSALTLAGLLYHLALVEEAWLEVRFLGLDMRDDFKDVDWDADPDWEFRTAATMEPEELKSRYRAACARSRAAAAGADSLDQLSEFKGTDGWQFTLRWVLLHLIEETARHAGHADLIREAIDGAVGE